MGLTKQYLRYASAGSCNLVASPATSVAYLDDKHCVVGAAENVYAWNLTRAEKVGEFSAAKRSRATVVKVSHNRVFFAVGYANGAVNIFDPRDQSAAQLTFAGHKSEVTCLAFSADDLLICSGGRDCTVIVWDIVNEAGLYRLNGHTGVVTNCYFSRKDVLITSSTDSLLKFWDLSCQHCFYTLSVSRSEIWRFVCAHEDKFLLVGTSESELYAYRIQWLVGEEEDAIAETNDGSGEKAQKISVLATATNVDESQSSGILKCIKLGTILRTSAGRVANLVLSPDESLILCSGAGDRIDILKLYKDDEVMKRINKKVKHLWKRNLQSGANVALEELRTSVRDDLSVRLKRLAQHTFGAKPKSFDMRLFRGSEIRVLVHFGNNRFQELRLKTQDVDKRDSLLTAVTKLTAIQAHTVEVRVLRFSNDNTVFLSGALDGVRIWSRDTLRFLCSLDVPGVTCATFLPGDKHVLVGTTKGTIHLFDIRSRALVQVIEGHSQAVTSIEICPDQSGVATGGADKAVRFWRIDVGTAVPSRMQLTLLTELSTSENIACFKFSANAKFIIVSLLDNTVKVFFLDSFKFVFCLYGHSLPVLCLDCSDDSELIVTGSADKNVKIWGMQFGDCHRSLFAHDDSVTCVQFLARTHLFFSAGKDGMIKQWNADKFELILTLEGHFGIIWAMALSNTAHFVISGGADFSIRMWEQTDEILVVQEEREIEREKEIDKEIESKDEEDVIPGEIKGEVALAAARTSTTIKSADGIIEAIDICNEYGTEQAKQKHPLMQAYGCTTAEKFIIEVLRRVRSSDLEKCLTLLPFNYVSELLTLLHKTCSSSCSASSELAIRCILFLLRIHRTQLAGISTSAQLFTQLGESCKSNTIAIRDMLGSNLAALRLLQKQLDENEEESIFKEAVDKRRVKQKRSRVTVQNELIRFL